MPGQKRPIRELNFAAKKPTVDEILAAKSRLNRASVDFLKIDLQTALTFSGIALQSSRDMEKRGRNRKNARKGYDTIVRLARKVSLNPVEAEFISHNLERLKSELQRLGEAF